MTQWGLDTLFNPAKRHMDDEKRRLQATREEAGDSSGGKRIDLASGKVVIRRDEGDTETGEQGDEGDRANGAGRPAGRTPRVGRGGRAKDEKTGRTAKDGSAKAEPSAAAVRAAKRRGRTI